MMTISISKNGALLFLFAVIAAAALAFTHVNTKDDIAAAERRAAKKALLEIVPQVRFDNDLLAEALDIPESARALLGNLSDEKIYVARKNQHIVAVIIPAVAPDGYSGDIKLIAGVNVDGTLAGVRVLSHKETPGLGDKIDLKKSQWITGFDGKSLQQPTAEGWQVRKDGGEFDQFTGATITPRAVVTQIYNILMFVEQHSVWLFHRPQTGETP